MCLSVMLINGCCARAVLFFFPFSLHCSLDYALGVVLFVVKFGAGDERTVDQVGGGILRVAGVGTGDVVLAGSVAVKKGPALGEGGSDLLGILQRRSEVAARISPQFFALSE
jgi:hypothetical protein